MIGKTRRLHLLGKAWCIAKPYWRSEDRTVALAMFVAVIVLNLVIVGTALMFTVWQGAFFDALEAKDAAKFVALLFWWSHSEEDGFAPSFLLNALILVPATAYSAYIQQVLELRWRRWHTDDYLDNWLVDRSYYVMSVGSSDADNPDQRIAEDIRLFVNHNLELTVGLLKALTTLASYAAVLWVLSTEVQLVGGVVPGALVWIALGYAACGTVVAHLIGSKLIPLNYNRERVEANFRYTLVRFRENTEGVAIHGIELSEKQRLGFRFCDIASNWRSLITTNRNLKLFSLSYEQFAMILPMAIVAPAYFAERILLGAMFQTSNSFFQVVSPDNSRGPCPLCQHD